MDAEKSYNKGNMIFQHSEGHFLILLSKPRFCELCKTNHVVLVNRDGATRCIPEDWRYEDSVNHPDQTNLIQLPSSGDDRGANHHPQYETLTNA